MSQLKNLASQTAIYGVSSILGRVLNYALVGLHTQVFLEQELGEVSYLYSFVALLLVTYTFGMETTLFRFASREKDKKYYHYAGTFVFALSTVLTIVIWVNSTAIAHWMQYPHLDYVIKWLAVILFIDAITAIPFAKLRLENKARAFVVAKMTTIIVVVGLHLLFLIVFPNILQGEYLASLRPIVASIFNDDLGIGYIFLANLIGNLLLILLLWKPISEFRFAFDTSTFRKMLLYASPIFITGIAGIASERMDNIILRNWLPEGFYEHLNSTEALGVYAQTVKLSIFMLLAIQAFRYAGEPFFFSQAEKKNSPELFAKVMHYFVLLSLVIFIGVSVNVDFIAQIFLRNPAYRIALYLVPFLLFGKLLWGIYINLSIWFKLTDKTIYGTYFSLLGALTTIVANLVLVPMIGYDGSAIAMICGYSVMCILCYQYGKKPFPIPYDFTPLLIHTIIAVIIVALAYQFQPVNGLIKNLMNFGIVIVYVFVLYLLEKKNLQSENT